jgi:hypothetical protein
MPIADWPLVKSRAVLEARETNAQSAIGNWQLAIRHPSPFALTRNLMLFYCPEWIQLVAHRGSG